MVVTFTHHYAGGIVFKGFVADDEENWNYEYHVEEWTVQYGIS